MYASNMKILTLNTNNTSPTTQGGGGDQATVKQLNNEGIENGSVGGSASSSGSNLKSNKREHKHNSKTKFMHGNNSKMQQHITQPQQQHQQQKYHHSNNNSNNGGNKLKKQHYNNSTNNTTSSLNRKKYYQQQQQQHHYQQQQQQQQYLSAMQQTINSTPTTTTIANNNSSLVRSQNYTNIDLLMSQQQRNITNTTNNLINHNTNQMETCTCLLHPNNSDKLTLSTSSSTPSSSTASSQRTPTSDYHRQSQQLHTISYDNQLKSSSVAAALSSNSKTLSTSVQQPTTSTASTCTSCWKNFTKFHQQKQQQQATLTNFKLTNTSSNLQEIVTAAVASKSHSNQNLRRTTLSTAASSAATTTSITATSASLTLSDTKKKSFWKNSNTCGSGSVAGSNGSVGGLSVSLTPSGYSTGSSTTQSPKLSKEKQNVSDKNLLTNTDSNIQILGKSSNNNVKKYSTAVTATFNTNQQKQISKNQVQAVDKIAMNTSVTGSNSSVPLKSTVTSKSNTSLSKTSTTPTKQQQDALEKHTDSKRILKSPTISSNSNSDTNKTNSLGTTTSTSLSTLTTTSVPSSPNSYTLDFLHSVGVKMTGVVVRSSAVQGSTNAYDNQSSTNSPVHSSYPYTGMTTNQRQPRYMYGGTNTNSGGGGNQQQHHHHHQPSQLTIASFLQKDFLGGDNVNSNRNTSNSASGSSSNSRNASTYNDQKQQQLYMQQQPPAHSRYHHSYYATPYQQQSTGLHHTNYRGGAAYGGELTRLVTNGVGGGQRNSSYAYTNYHNAQGDGGVGKNNSMPQQQTRQLQNIVGTYTNSLNNSQANKKSSYASSTTSNCSSSSSKSTSSNTSSRQLQASAAQESNNSSSNFNLAIETLPSKTLGVGNQRGNHRGHHNNHHGHHHHNHHGHHHQHSMMNSPNMLQHQNYNNLTYVSTDGSTNGVTSRGCSPPPQSLPPTPLSASSIHSPKPLDNSPGPVAMLMNFNANHLQYPRYANTQQQMVVQQQQQFHQFQQQQQQSLLNNKMLAPLTLAMPSLSPSPTPQNTASTSSNNQQAQPPPHNIICCSQLDEVTTAAAAAAATSSSNSGVIVGNEYDSDTSSNNSSAQQKYHSINPITSSLSTSSSSSSETTTSLSLMPQQTQQQNCSQPTTPATCGHTTPLHSPNEYNYIVSTTHPFPNLQVSQQLAAQHCYKSSNETHMPQIYANNGNGVVSLHNLHKKSLSGYTDDDYQQQPLPQHQFYFNTTAGQTSVDHLHIASAVTAVANRANGSGGYWSPSHHNNQFLYQQTSSTQVALMPPTASSSSSCDSSSAPISPRLSNDEIQQTQQQLQHTCCLTNASTSPSPCASCLSEQFGNIIGTSSNAESGMLLAGSNSSLISGASNNSTNGGHDYKKGSSQLLAPQQQRLIAQQTYQSSSSSTSTLSGSSDSTLTSTVRVRVGSGGSGINTNNERTHQTSITTSVGGSITVGPQQLQPPPPTQHFYSHHQQQPLPPPLPPHNLLYNNPQTHHMRALSSSSISSSVHDFFTHTPPDRFLARAHLVEAKEAPATLLNKSKWDHLSQGIWKKFISSQQTEETFKQKMRLWRFLYLFIKNAYPRYGLYLVGSTTSGFGSDSSDVDMCLVSRSASSIDPRMEALFNLTVLRDCLSKSGEFENFNLIEAKVPILRFRDRIHQLEVDLNFNNCVGIKNTHLLYCYSQLDWRLRPLVLVTKLWAQYHNINNAKNMTISSYSLVLMVIHFLQYAVNPPVLPCLHELFPDKFPLLRSNDFGYVDMNETIGPYESKNSQTIGELFLCFLEYYSYFDYTQFAISIRTGGILPINVCRVAKSIKNDIHQWKELCIEEPFDLTNTARSVYDFETFERVKAVFVASWRVLQETLDINSVFSPIIIPLPCSTGASALTDTDVTTTNTTAFSEIESDVVTDTKNHLERYVNSNSTINDLVRTRNAAVGNYEENKNISIEEEIGVDIGAEGFDEGDNNTNANNTVTTIATTSGTIQKISKRKDLNRTLTPRQTKMYDEKEFPATLSQTSKLPVPSSSSSSLTCIKTSTKNVNRTNSNKTTTPIKS